MNKQVIVCDDEFDNTINLTRSDARYTLGRVVTIKEHLTQMHDLYTSREGGAVPKAEVLEDIARLHEQACYVLYRLGVPKEQAYLSFIGPHPD